MKFEKNDLPNIFRLQERENPDGSIGFDLFVDVGEYINHDNLFEKYDFEPSGYGWQDLISQIIKKHDSILLNDIIFDCSGDEFFVMTKSEGDQLKGTKYFIQICKNPELLESLIKNSSKDVH